jgi:polyisoprenoid-binding protein YceI
MSTSHQLRHIVAISLSLFLLVPGFSQIKYGAKNNINLTVAGTSTMHDWTMKSASGDCSAIFTTDASGNLTDITTMQFSVSSKALKSGKSKMDENAYDALKADKNPQISAVLKDAVLSTKDNKTYSLKGSMKLTIAGKTLDTDLQATLTRKPDHSIQVKGDKKISMKEYGMEPPSFMMGTIKTGNDITLSFDLNLNK